MARRAARALGVVGSTLVGLALAHSLVYLVRYGSAYGEALTHAGHGVAWTVAVVSAAMLGAGLAIAGALQLRRLTTAGSTGSSSDQRPALPQSLDATGERRRVRRWAGRGRVRSPGVTLRVTTDRQPSRDPVSSVRSNLGRTDDRRSSLSARWLVTSARIATTTAILLTIQENVERAWVGLPVPGIGLLLSPEYPWSPVVVAGVGLVVGLVVALFRWRRDVLIARLRSARMAARPAVAPPVPAWIPLRPAASVLGRAQGLRAPPRAAAA